MSCLKHADRQRDNEKCHVLKHAYLVLSRMFNVLILIQARFFEGPIL